MTAWEQQRMRQELLMALYEARKRVAALEEELARHDALRGEGVERAGASGEDAPAAPPAPASPLYRHIGLIEPEEDISNFLGREGHEGSRPRLGPDAPPEVRPDKARPLSPLTSGLVDRHPDDALLLALGDKGAVSPAAPRPSRESRREDAPPRPGPVPPPGKAGASPEAERLEIEDFLLLCGAESRSLRPGPFPLADVRSPSEFVRGHIPGAVNIPLFSDEERAEVGTLYRREGREAAVTRGLEFAGPRMAELVRSAFALCRARTGGELALYCDRGGMRSASVAWLFTVVGLRAHVLTGGYKAFRRYALACFERPRNLLVLGGKTGAGKTRVLARLAARGARVIDLEGLARHRGSAFGALAGEEQPTREQFENSLALALERAPSGSPVWVEDESENLGTVNVPRAFFRQLRASPLFALEVSDRVRLARVLEDYGSLSPEYMGRCLDNIKKRLGGLEHGRAHACLAAGDLPGLAVILLDYYDRAYAKQAAGRVQAAAVRADDPDEAALKLLELGF